MTALRGTKLLPLGGSLGACAADRVCGRNHSNVALWLHVGPRVWWGGCWHGGGCLWGCAGVGWVAWCVYRDSDVAPKSAAITGNFILELVVEQLQKERDRRMSGTEA